LEDENTKSLSVMIPLIINEEYLAEDNEDFIALNYDPIGSEGGATVEYNDPDGGQRSVRTKKVWLRSETPQENPDHREEVNPSPTSNPDKVSPKTSDTTKVIYVVLVMVTAISTMAIITTLPRKKKKEEADN